MEAPKDLTGMTVGRFAIRARLGAGGMGEVYRAEDTKLKRLVALKRIASQMQSDVACRKRFLKEAEHASRLTDPHIAQIYDVFEANNEIFLVMEYVEGQTLRQCLSRPLAVDRFLDIATQCAKALASAHERGVIHCDIKPANIMLTRAGQVKMLDFGVAKELSRADASAVTTTLTGPGEQPGGTPAYVAPEVLLQKEVDGRADLFSLGVVFYEALTGQNPFLAGTLAATSDRILHEVPPPLTQLSPHVPAELDRIIGRMLAKDPAQRYSTAEALVIDLRALVDGADSRFRLGGHDRHVRRRATAIVAGLVLAASLVAATAVPRWRQKFKSWFSTVEVPQKKQLAVLPFQELGGNREAAAFGDGLTETLTAKFNQLAANHSLEVIPAGEVRSQGIKTLEQARRELGANLVLQGTLHRVGEMVRVTCVLVDASRRRQLRGDTITAPASDPFALEDRVAASALEMLEIELQPQERQALAAHGTRQPAAYDYYLRGRGYLQDYHKSENIDGAITAFNNSLGIDPSYALAYAGLGEAYWRKYESSKDTAWIDRARDACKSAANLDSKAGAVHICLGTLESGTGHYERAVPEFQSALDSDRNNDAAYRGLASAYESQGRIAEAERTYHRAINTRPSYWAGYYELSRFLFRSGRYVEAAAQLRSATELAPDNPRAFTLLGGIYHMMGRDDEAIAALNKSLEIRPTGEAYTNLGTVYYFQGRYQQSVPMMEKAIELGAGTYLRWGNLGEAYRQTPELAAKAPGAYEHAARLAEQQLSVNPRDAEGRAWLAFYDIRLGKKRAALTEIERARRLAPRNVNVLFRAADVYELAGHRERALSALESAIQSGYSMDEIRRAADLTELRKDPRYGRLVERQLPH